MLKVKTGQRDWIHSQPWLNNSTNWDADSLNGELFSKSEMDFHPNKRSNKTLGVLPDTQLSANKTDSFQSLSQKFFQMDHIQLNTVKE